MLPYSACRELTSGSESPHTLSLPRSSVAQVDNLNTSQLNLGVWSGDIKLRNLRLKKDALDKLNLPIDVMEGYLGELTIKIAWQVSPLHARPW